MHRSIAAALASVTLALTIPATASAGQQADLAAAVSAPTRPDKLVALDESRKPAETLAFLGLRRGMKVADIMTGSGYWAEIMAKAVGPRGKVTAFEPNQFTEGAEGTKQWADLQARLPGVRFERYPFEAFQAAANSFDFTIINLSYHDLYWESAEYKIPKTDPAAFLKALYIATKPGGIVGIIDHVGLAGDTRAIVDKVHRIDPATVKADFAAAGFVLEAESPLLGNAADDHDKSVFDPTIRGKTDRFLYRFRKPR